MIEGQKILGIIPARGGSKTIPRKNVKVLAGKPLIAWTIEAARKSQYLDRLILSSEDAEIIEVAREWGCEVPLLRPVELAQDDTPGIEPVIHAINTIGEKFDYIVLLQPTSPLRTVKDIDDCIRYCIQEDAQVCVSVCAVDKNPYWMHTLDESQRLCPLMPEGRSIERRQDLPPVYAENGAIYVAKTEFILKKKNFVTEETLSFIMPAERSLDIDNEMDFLYCELIKTNLLGT
jgi:CMP-N,N'-diacetyllegionaminic acid synthase